MRPRWRGSWSWPAPATIETATGLAETALAGGLEHSLLFNLVAGRREAQGRFEEALGLLERAHGLNPQDIGVRQALGLVLHRLERYTPRPSATSTPWSPRSPVSPQATSRAGCPSRRAATSRAPRPPTSGRWSCSRDNLAAMAGASALASRRGAHDEARRLAEEVLRASPDTPTP